VGYRHRTLALALPALLLTGAAGAAPGGTISGRVAWTGAPPVPSVVPITKDQESCGEQMTSEALVVSPRGRGVRYAVVSLEGVTETSTAQPSPVTLENKGCRFVPHVLALRLGGELEVVNGDPVLHNLRGWVDTRRSVLNVVQPTQGQVSRRTIKRGGVIRLTCDTHVHMNGWLLTFEHPYFAVTDEEGKFTIRDVPPGSYRVNLWHEGWNVVRREPPGRLVYDAPRVLSRDVMVPARGTVTVGFELSE
jgi:hypothetical protein